MAFLLQTARSTTLGVFGYLPGQPDFVRVRAAGREVRRLEDWLERGLHQARWEMGGAFAGAYPRLFHRFLFRPDNSPWVLIGVLCASVDNHQRPFPFVAFELLPTGLWDRQPALLLGKNGGFFSALEDLVRAVGSHSHIGQVHSQVINSHAAVFRDLAAPQNEDLVRQAARYQNFLQETRCGELGDGQGVTGVALCHDLLQVLEHKQDPRLLRQALLIPLGRPLYARELELRFYLDLVEKRMAGHNPTLTMFWQLGSSLPGHLLLSFREPTFDLFSALLLPRESSRGIRKLGQVAPSRPGEIPRRRPEDDLLESTCLHTLLGRLAGKAPANLAKRKRIGGL